MTMYSLCTQLVEQGKLEAALISFAEAERRFTRELGVLRRRFLQCVPQPHLIWAATEWTSERAHNAAAQSIMQVRADDRVASAFFRPGQYWEAFALPVPGAQLDGEGPAEHVIVARMLVADRCAQGWEERVAARFGALARPAGLVRAQLWQNYACRREAVAFLEWRDEAAYAAGRLVGERTVEEELLVAAPRSDLASYDQFECRPLSLA
jgi:heme-degrading monooxygenase HmoA